MMVLLGYVIAEMNQHGGYDSETRIIVKIDYKYPFNSFYG
jgi:hypothetical protein